MVTFNNEENQDQPQSQPTQVAYQNDFQTRVNALVNDQPQTMPQQQTTGIPSIDQAPQQQAEQPPQKEGIFKRAIKFIGSGVINYANDSANISGSNREAKAEDESNLAVTNKILPSLKEKLNSGAITKDEYSKQLQKLQSQSKKDLKIGFDLPTNEQVIGDAIQTGLTIAPPLEIEGLATRPILKRLFQGGIYGAAWGGAQAMSENKSLGDSLEQAALTAPFGAGAELLLPYALRAASKVTSKIVDKTSGAAGEVVNKAVNSSFGEKFLKPVGNFLQDIGNKFTSASSKLPDIMNLVSINRRLSDENMYGDYGKQIVDGFSKATNEARMQMGHAVSTFEDAGMFGKSDEELWKAPDSLLNQLEGRFDAKTADPTYQAADKFRSDILNMAQEVIPGFKGRENYYPHLIPGMDILSNSESKVRQDIIENMVLHNDFKSPDEASHLLDSYVDFVKNEGGKGFGNDVLAYMVKSGQADSVEQARGMLLRSANLGDQGLTRKFGSLEDKRAADLPFYDPNPARSLLTYGLNSYKRLNIIDQFGAADEKLNTLVGQIASEKGDQAGRQATELIKTLTGTIKKIPGEQQASAFLRTLQVLRISTAQILHLGQSVNELLVSDFGPWFKGIKAAFSDEGIQNALMSGSTVEQSIRNHLAQQGYGQQFTDHYMRTIGFNSVIRMNRTISSNVGMLQGEHLLNKIISNPSDELSKAALGDLLGQDRLAEVLKNNALSDEDRYIAGQTMTNMTQFNYDPGSHPNFWATPSGKVIFQFKRFAYDQATFVKNTLMNQLKRGDTSAFMKSMFTIATVVPLTNEVILDIKSLITQQRRPTNAFDRYVQDMAHMGGFGILFDTFQNALSGHLAESLLGPTIGEGVNLTQDAVGVFSGKHNAWTNALKNLTKDFLYQTGLVGGILNRTVPGLKSKSYQKKDPANKSILEQIFSEGNPLKINTAQAKGTGENPNVISNIDMTHYAESPKHPARVKSIYDSLPEFSNAQDMDAYMKSRKSPISGQAILSAANRYGIDPKLLIAEMQQDSGLGTKGAGARNKNPGNVATYGTKSFKYNTWDEGVMGTARALARFRTQDLAGIDYSDAKKYVASK